VSAEGGKREGATLEARGVGFEVSAGMERWERASMKMIAESLRYWDREGTERELKVELGGKEGKVELTIFFATAL